MKQQITLTNDTIYSLKNLIDEIDYEESMEGDCNTDQVIEDLYKIKELIARALL